MRLTVKVLDVTLDVFPLGAKSIDLSSNTSKHTVVIHLEV